MVDTLDLGSSAARRESSSLSFRTNQKDKPMLNGLFYLLVFLTLGELIHNVFNLPIPGSIIGMVILLCSIISLKKIPESLKQAAASITPLLPLFIIPVSAGLITQRELLSQYGIQLLIILFVSLIPGIAVTALIMNWGKKGSAKE